MFRLLNSAGNEKREDVVAIAHIDGIKPSLARRPGELRGDSGVEFVDIAAQAVGALEIRRHVERSQGAIRVADILEKSPAPNDGRDDEENDSTEPPRINGRTCPANHERQSSGPRFFCNPQREPFTPSGCFSSRGRRPRFHRRRASGAPTRKAQRQPARSRSCSGRNRKSASRASSANSPTSPSRRR